MPSQDDEDRFESVTLLECNIDDMTGEALAHVRDRLLEQGALDAWLTPIAMKKGRPGTLVSALCRPADAEALRTLLLRETTTLGVRWHALEREIAHRRWVTVDTRWGPVRVKLKILDGRVAGAKPEYEDCARLADEQGLPLLDVQREALRRAEDEGVLGGDQAPPGSV